MEPHLLNVSQVVKKLNSSLEQGLTYHEAQRLHALLGPNRNTHLKPKRFFSFIFTEMYQSKIVLFSACALIAGFLEYEFAAICGTIFILVQTFCNAIIQRNAYQKLKAIQNQIVFMCRVMRDGNELRINANELVPGDLLILEVGQWVPADARIVDSEELYVNESILTECITPVAKQSDIVEDEARLADRSNMIYKGTWILSGQGKAIVIAIGLNTAIAQSERKRKEKKYELPFGRMIEKFSRVMFNFVCILAASSIIAHTYLGLTMPDWFFALIGWCIAFFPRAIMALWQRKIARSISFSSHKNIIIQNQSVLQKLGRVSVILLDIPDLQKSNEVAGLIKQARARGIKIVLMSDQCMNAILPFAQELGIYTENDRVLDIAHCGYIADEELMRLIATTTIYAQINELNKIRIIKLFNKLGKVVAVTGQNLADISVLEAADIGFARPQAADMVKEKSDIVLLDSSFALLLLAIKQGARVNRRLKWLLISIGSLFLLFIAWCSIDYFSKTAIVMGNYIYR